MTFIKLTRPNDTDVWINPSLIFSLEESKLGGTYIYFPVKVKKAEVAYEKVKETPEEIIEKIKEVE